MYATAFDCGVDTRSITKKRLQGEDSPVAVIPTATVRQAKALCRFANLSDEEQLRELAGDLEACAMGDENTFESNARAVLAALDAAGFVVMPKEPTPEILSAMARHNADYISDNGPYPRSRRVYRAMIEAKP